MSPLLLGTVISVFLLCAPSSALDCLDEDGKPVDWFVLYKLPTIAKSKEFLIRRGLAYMYVTSARPSADWTLSTLSINDSRSMPGRTVGPIYQGISTDFLYALYNDDPPSSSAGMIYGHTKGVVLAEDGGGVWLIHSVPNFPIEPISAKTNVRNKYKYPLSATRYGQSFLCISLPADQLNMVGAQLMFYRPKVYSFSLPDGLAKAYMNLTLLSQGRYVRDPPWYHKAILKSRGGVKFTSYAKAGRFGKDLYAGWVAPDLNSDLQVETWSNGAGELPSDCKARFHVMDVLDVALKVNASTAIQFKNSQDHSKWAVSDSEKTTVCIGDINRMAAQLKRGGGTVCFKNSAIWKRYAKAIQGVQPCSGNLTKKHSSVFQEFSVTGQP